MLCPLFSLWVAAITPEASIACPVANYEITPLHPSCPSHSSVLTFPLVRKISRSRPHMSFNDALRRAARLPGKIFTGILALSVFVLIALAVTSGSLIYRVVSPATTAVDVFPAGLPGHPQPISFTVQDGKSREGWFFPGRRFAPTIILCHGYRSHIGEILTLASALQENQFNVFIFDFSGHGKSDGWSRLGFRETDEVLAVIRELARRDDVDTKRFGIWGSDMGAYAAASAALTDQRVHALVLDSLYDQPRDFLRIQLTGSGVSRLPFVRRVTEWDLKLLNYSDRNRPPLSAGLPRLANIPKLFIQSQQAPQLAESCLAVYAAAPAPKENWWAPGIFINMLDREKREYENRIVSFFLLNLPLSSSSPPSPR